MAKTENKDKGFPVGPPDPVTDSRDLPAVSAKEEGKVLAKSHAKDDEPLDPDVPQDELDELVKDVDRDDVDDVGYGDEEDGS